MGNCLCIKSVGTLCTFPTSVVAMHLLGEPICMGGSHVHRTDHCVSFILASFEAKTRSIRRQVIQIGFTFQHDVQLYTFGILRM